MVVIILGREVEICGVGVAYHIYRGDRTERSIDMLVPVNCGGYGFKKIASSIPESTTTYASLFSTLGGQMSSLFNNNTDWKTVSLRIGGSYIGQCIRASTTFVMFQVISMGSNIGIYVFTIYFSSAGEAKRSLNGAAPTVISSNYPATDFGSNLAWDIYI